MAEEVKTEETKEVARRYNSGKPRFDLPPVGPYQDLVQVYTRGAHKYTIYKDQEGNEISGKDFPYEEVAGRNLTVVDDGADNWRKGDKWLNIMASVKRHIAAWENGEDIDPDPSMLTPHLANAVWGLFTLLEYRKICPWLDNRKHTYLTHPKVGLDIDEVLTEWLKAYKVRYGFPDEHEFSNWWIDFNILDQCRTDMRDDFYLALEPAVKPQDIPFDPHCYITSRDVPTETSEQWLFNHGFPCRPVHTVKAGASKVAAAKAAGIDIMIDDVYKNFVELNQGGVFCLLWDRPHNRRYDVGSRRITSFEDFKKRFL